MKRIGILGGISHYTTVEYYNRIMNLYKERFHDMNYPEIVIYSLSHGIFKEYEDSKQIEKYADYISGGIEGLIKSGVEIIALAANSPHSKLENLRSRFEIPFVSAIDSAFNESARLKITEGLLLGIKFTMQSNYYQERFLKGGISLKTPNLDEQELVNDIIYNRLISGQKIDSYSKETILKIISNYEVDGIILGCMRLPVFFNSETISGINLVNTLNRHIEDILEIALE
jgi:aspartate racemase